MQFRLKDPICLEEFKGTIAVQVLDTIMVVIVAVNG